MNALTVFQGGQVPAHIAAAFADEGNIADKVTVNSISYTGKVWTLSIDGTKTKLIKRNADGDEEPVSVMKVILCDYNRRRGRAYYEGDYDPDNTAAPLCWSNDGIAPPDTVPAKQSPKCETCPKAVKGSKINAQGKPTVACPQHKMLAVVPAAQIGKFPPLRLKIAITSIYDKTSTDQMAQGWMAFDQYMDYLKSNGVNHTAQIVTKIKFDPTTAYPKLFFAVDRWLEPSEVQAVLPIVKSDAVKELLDGSWTPAGADGVKTDEQVAPALPPQTQTTSADEDDDEAVFAGINAPAAEPVQEPVQAAVTPKATKPKPEPKKAAAQAEAAVEAPSTQVPDGLASLLDEWGD